MAYGNLLTDVVQSSTTGTAPVFKDGNGTEIGTLCKAWVNFTGSTSTINASFNVSSITRNTTGDYYVNFTNAMPDVNYVAHVGNGGGYNDINANTSARARVWTYNFANPPGSADRNNVMVSVFR